MLSCSLLFSFLQTHSTDFLPYFVIFDISLKRCVHTLEGESLWSLLPANTCKLLQRKLNLFISWLSVQFMTLSIELKPHKLSDSSVLWQRVFYFCYYSPEGFTCNLQALRRLWLVWMRRLEMSSCLLRPVRSARRPSLCGRRTTNPSVTVPEWLSQLKAERKLDL